MLMLSVDTQNQAQLGTALQVYKNLNRLKPTVDMLMTKNKETFEGAVAGLLEAATAPQGGSSNAARRATLWSSMEAVFETLVTVAVRVCDRPQSARCGRPCMRCTRGARSFKVADLF